MRYELISATPDDWARKTDIVTYAQRQAQSCTYLEKVFDAVEQRMESYRAELSDLFGELRLVHRRQYADLEHLIAIPRIDDRKSFYFDRLYSAFKLSPLELPELLAKDDLLAILAIQAVSYVRGRDRYRLLKDHEETDNAAFKPVWAAFYNDAAGNAAKVFQFMDAHFDKNKTEEKVYNILEAEDEVIHTIWRHNHVTAP
ncbi:hypothetical protein HYS49_01350 [Candidatus Woesearchaeota archaeon]|nr:hypothetical protein [Candidatus Woesearchaeota archaeon]